MLIAFRASRLPASRATGGFSPRRGKPITCIGGRQRRGDGVMSGTTCVCWVSCLMAAMSERNAAPPRSSADQCAAPADERANVGAQGRDDALAVGLADHVEADEGGDEIADGGGEVGGHGIGQRDAVRGCRDADGDGIGDVARQRGSCAARSPVPAMPPRHSS